MSRTGTLFIISAPSGTGKSTLLTHVIGLNPQKRMLSVSHTSREPRKGEQHGVEYYFISAEDFKERIEKSEFVEWAEVFGNYYGTSKTAIEKILLQGKDVFLDIDWQGAQQLKKVIPNVTTIYILPPSKTILHSRLQGRDLDATDVVEHRMDEAVKEMSHHTEYDYVIINDDLEQAKLEIQSIVMSKRLQRPYQVEKHHDLIKKLLEE